ncbi:MAG: allantoate amidohydrolase [Pseudomonadota bacterium]
MVGALSQPLAKEQASGARAYHRCKQLGVAPFSSSTEGLDRRYLTAAHAATVGKISTWMVAAGMTTRLDSMATLIGRYEGTDPDAPALMIGSHIDSVPNGGVFDGPLGVMLGIELVARLYEEGTRFEFPVEVAAFGDEEGSRFHASMMSSRAMAGAPIDSDLQQTDAADIDVPAALSAFDALLVQHTDLVRGGNSAAAAQRSNQEVAAFIETHIEQGPVLEAEGLALGVVTSIAGQLRYSVEVRGAAAHAGTTTMDLRSDALTAAAEMTLAAETIARSQSAKGVVATVGQLDVFPGGSNVVPGRVFFSLDVRAPSNAYRDAAAASIEERFHAIAEARGVQLSLGRQQDLAATPCDPELTDLLRRAVSSIDGRAFELFSGAGHDTMSVAGLCPVTMLFVRCDRGISHHPDENILPGDAEQALDALFAFTKLYEGTRHVAPVR